MSSKSLATPFIRHVTSRGYAQTAPVAKKEPRLQTSVLPNKTFVAALDNGSPVTRLTIAFKAGSRYEPQTELGLAHVLRSAAGLSTKNSSAYMIRRQLTQIGASFTASGDREFIYYTVEATQDNLKTALEYLNKIVSNQEFRPWELTDNLPRLRYDIAALPPQVRAVDLLHKAAYRRGLGNSLFIAPKKIGKISSESLQHFASNNLVPNRCAIALIGDNQDTACLLADSLQLSSLVQESKSDTTTYYGGELRKEMGGDLAHVALALQGAPASIPQSLALAVAARALGCGPVTKWGANNSPVAKAIGNIGPFAAAGFNVSYSDSGLFGVVLSVPKDEANAAVKAVANLLKQPLSADAIKAGKNQLKLQVLAEAEDGTSLVESLAAQGLFTGSAKSPLDIAREIDQLSTNDVSQAMANASRSKLSMGSAGNLVFVPFVDEL
ncbi:PREDICTED: cytochrome b-c1 complex subunit 2, mitochondrial-like [Papilio xuthus]|uniref:Cytochrome b-c1 complex subunit 2, mitochondrial n=1 Tax=Papilio xuthus TaxID=66420 RepID=A0A194Q1X6_PAPXU|nr:Cytochrome b-c1 complex subunit 2, mitochondrial [Papilio xuthus]